MTGGHGVSGGIAPLVEASGVTGAETVAYTAATFGLIAGSLMGGPVANRLIIKHNLLEKEPSHQVNINTALLTVRPRKLNADSILHGFIMILVAMFIGSYLTEALNYLVGQLTDRAAFPSYMGPMIIAIALRYISDRRNSKEYHELVPEQEVEVLGNIGLNVFWRWPS